MDGFSIQKYELCKKYAKDLDLVMTTSGNKIKLTYENETICGIFETINDVFNFLCGFEQGYNKLIIKSEE